MVSQPVPFCISSGMCCALPISAQCLAGPTPEGKEKSTGFLLLVIVLLWPVWVCLLRLRAGLDWTIGVASRVHAAARTPTQTYTHKYKTVYRDARSQKHKNKTKYRGAGTKTCSTKNREPLQFLNNPRNPSTHGKYEPRRHVWPKTRLF